MYLDEKRQVSLKANRVSRANISLFRRRDIECAKIDARSMTIEVKVMEARMVIARGLANTSAGVSENGSSGVLDWRCFTCVQLSLVPERGFK